MRTRLPRHLVFEAYRRGQAAFQRGLKCAPVLDTEFCKLSYWVDDRMMEAWILGWTRANLKTAQLA